MQRTIGIFLLLCFTAPVAGTYLWLRFERKQVRREVKAKILNGIERDQLTLLSFTYTQAAQQLTWEHAGEFTYKDEKYDIVEQHTNHGKTKYWCWHDTKESGLDKQLTDLVHKAFGDGKQRNERDKQVVQVFKVLHYQPYFPTHIHSQNEDFETTEKACFCSINHYVSRTDYSIVQPPELG